MSFNIHSPGLYTFTNGADILWGISQHLSTLNTNQNIYILLPTQRSANRLKGLLKKAETPLNYSVLAYNEFTSETPDHRDLLLLWQLCNTPNISQAFLKSEEPDAEQCLALFNHLHSAFNELFLHEITPNKLEEVLLEHGNFNYSHYIKAFKSYLDLLSEHNILPLAQQQAQHYNKLTSDVTAHSNTLFFIVIDGPIPPGICHLAAEISTHGVVLLKDSTVTKNIKQYINSPPKPLDLFVPRNQLRKALNNSHFYPVTHQKDWQNISRIEVNDTLQLAYSIIDIARKHFNNGDKVVTLVTPKREIAKLVKQLAAQEAISVDDSFGDSLINHPCVMLLYSVIKWLKTPHNHVLFLEVFTSTFAPIELQKIAQKIDILARTKQISLSVALKTYPPESDSEVEWIQFIEQHFNSTPPPSFAKLLTFALSLLGQYNISPEHQELMDFVQEKLANIHSLAEFELLLGALPYQEKSPTLPFLQIIGPLEARLLNPKVAILADLNETEWPLPFKPLWLPRSVVSSLNLPTMQDISTLSSDVLLSLLGAQSVYLLRTLYSDGIENIPSRWWVRLNVLAKLSNVENITSFEASEQTEKTNPLEFKLPKELIPPRISISQLQQYIQSPKKFIAEILLKAPILPEWHTKADHKDKGILVHDVLNQALKDNLSYQDALLIANNKLKPLNLNEVERVFWKEDLSSSLAHFYTLNETTHPARSWTELKGEWCIHTEYGALTIVGKADRIDEMPDGSLHVIDYKTGSLPTKKDVLTGTFPQLTILGLMLKNGAFTGIKPQAPFLVSYWGVKDGASQSFLFEELEGLEKQFINLLTDLLNPETILQI